MTGDSEQGAKREPPTIDLTASEIPHGGNGAKSTNDAKDANSTKPAWRSHLGAALVGACAALIAIGAVALSGIWPQRELRDVPRRLGAIEAQQQSLAARPGDGDRLARLETRLTALADDVATLRQRNEAMQTALREADARATAAATAEAGKAVAVFGETVAQQRRDARADLDKSVDAINARIAALESATKSVEQALAQPAAEPDAARAMQAALLASALNDAVRRGTPFAAELDAASPWIDANSAAALAPFAATGVPQPTLLAQQLIGLLPALRKATAPAVSNGSGTGWIDRLQASAERIIRVRPLGEPAGDDSAAVLARIEAKARHDDIAGARAELLALPSHAPADAWLDAVAARDAALAAARDVSARALAAVAKPVSRQP